jgi:hypothetical protein
MFLFVCPPWILSFRNHQLRVSSPTHHFPVLAGRSTQVSCDFDRNLVQFAVEICWTLADGSDVTSNLYETSGYDGYELPQGQCWRWHDQFHNLLKIDGKTSPLRIYNGIYISVYMYVYVHVFVITCNVDTMDQQHLDTWNPMPCLLTGGHRRNSSDMGCHVAIQKLIQHEAP